MSLQKNIILDVDGVIFDSNGFKENNIFAATREFCDEETAKIFSHYFTTHNGLPRKHKIDHYFKGNPDLASNILLKYNELNATGLKAVNFTRDAENIIKELSCQFNLFALSGGESIELNNLFNEKNIKQFFAEVLGGPITKDVNLQKIISKGFAYFVGDSKIDHEVAANSNIPFVFMYGYTQFANWETYFKKFQSVVIVKDLPGFYKIIK